jgi:hypothetical protein
MGPADPSESACEFTPESHLPSRRPFGIIIHLNLQNPFTALQLPRPGTWEKDGLGRSLSP